MSRGLVAIIGRPNVGKSTLFNRIVGKRTAIVDDTPGVTRDRHYAEAEWTGKHFAVVDTGGFVPDSMDVFETAIREQAQIAIDEADVVLFVVDGVGGLLPSDHEVAEVLRKSQKRVILVVNKIDNEKRELELAEFYRLGLGDPVAISALGGRRIGDLLDMITGEFSVVQKDESDDRLKIAVIGKPNVGKSSFVNALLKEERHIVTSIPGTTRDPIDAIVRFYGEELILVDTAGLRRKSKVKESIEFYSTVRTIKSIERCDVAIILLDAQQGLEHQDLRIVETAVSRKRGIVIAVNKWDLVEKDERTAHLFAKALRERLRIYDYVPIIFISALTGQRVHKVLELTKEVSRERSRRIPTSKLNELIGNDIKAVPPKSKSGREIKIKYITQVREKPPVFAFYCNDPTMIDDNYRRYLENRLRSHFVFRGVPLALTFKQK